MTQLTSFIDDHADDLIEFTGRLVATPSPNLPGDERAVAKVVCDELTRLGLHGAEVVSKDARRPNVLFRLKGSSPGPTLMFCGHSDTKPVGDPGKWKTDPFSPSIIDGKMYGLGTTDMKAAVAAMVYATAALADSQSELVGDLLLVINADEERTMDHGSGFLAEEYGIQADVALLGEPSGIDGAEFEFLHIVSRGLCCFTIRVQGTQMHSSLTDRLPSQNANLLLARVLDWLHNHLELEFQPHPLCPAPTINLAVKFDGGVGYGVCPGVAEFQSDIRTLPGMTRDQLEADVRECLDGFRQQDPTVQIDFEFEQPPLDWFPPTEVSADHPLVEALLLSANDVLGFRPKISAFPGGSDAKNFQAVAGIPTIPSFGPGWLPLAHGPNECVGVDAIVQAARIYALAATRYLA